MKLDRVSVTSPISIDILMVHNDKGQSSHVLVFSVNLEQQISRHKVLFEFFNLCICAIH